ncbi:MAG: imidazole glycerol phosphate synthase subunit HisH [Eubacteriales bacterium]
MVAIVDYGVGNLFSLYSSFEAVGEESCVTSDIKVIDSADRLVLPGVGAFGDAAEKLRSQGLDKILCEQVAKGKPLLGICLGMQMLFEKSFEYGEHLGLGLIPGEIRPISETIQAGLKIPHIGWNALTLKKKSPLFRELNDGDFVYFVHSYHAVNCSESVSAVTEYGGILTAAVEKDNVFGCQFHPEKSGEKGLCILKAFCDVK